MRAPAPSNLSPARSERDGTGPGSSGRSRTGVRTELTRSGWGLVGGIIGLCAAAAVFGMQELYALAAGAIVLLLASACWSRGRQFHLDSERTLRPARASVGDSVRVRIRVRNPSWRRSPLLEVRDPFDQDAESVCLRLAPLGPGEESVAEYRLSAERRGVFGLGPLRIELADPFGLVRTVRFGAPRSSLTVHPRVERLRPLPLANGLHRRGSAGSPVLGGTGEDFHSIREFRTGDDSRRIHWSSTARLDQLMFRQDDTPWHGRITIALDLRADRHDDASLEAALSAAASLSAAARAAKSPVRLVTTAGADTGFGSSPKHHAGILDTLASARAEGGGPVMGALGSGGGLAGGGLAGGGLAGGGPDGTVVAVLTDPATDEDLSAMNLAWRKHDLTVVLIGRDGGSPARPSGRSSAGDSYAGDSYAGGASAGDATSPQSALAHCRRVEVPSGSSFAHAWNAAMAGVNGGGSETGVGEAGVGDESRHRSPVPGAGLGGLEVS